MSMFRRNDEFKDAIDLCKTGRYKEAIAKLEDDIARLRVKGNGKTKAMAERLFWLGSAWVMSDDHQAGVEVLQSQTLPTILEAGLRGTALHGNACYALGYSLNHLGNFSDARRALEDALPMLKKVDKLEYARCLNQLGEALLGVGDRMAALEKVQESQNLLNSLKIDSSSSSITILCRSLVVMGKIKLSQGEKSQAQELGERAVVLLEQSRYADPILMRDARMLAYPATILQKGMRYAPQLGGTVGAVAMTGLIYLFVAPLMSAGATSGAAGGPQQTPLNLFADSAASGGAAAAGASAAADAASTSAFRFNPILLLGLILTLVICGMFLFMGRRSKPQTRMTRQHTIYSMGVAELKAREEATKLTEPKQVRSD